jgi:hypothetical protein
MNPANEDAARVAVSLTRRVSTAKVALHDLDLDLTT